MKLFLKILKNDNVMGNSCKKKNIKICNGVD